eukprot:TRINITY_DN6919_c0_g1_i1.p2 TRINITY_DN6919_c0_g1~~TRINITY_DN6919_c0_g1_i1.p2  ORF type:complete len:466 (+),score=123.81 TRINITY_DN6919_c0_g1_i1:117-1400(+)
MWRPVFAGADPEAVPLCDVEQGCPPTAQTPMPADGSGGAAAALALAEPAASDNVPQQAVLPQTVQPPPPAHPDAVPRILITPPTEAPIPVVAMAPPPPSGVSLFSACRRGLVAASAEKRLTVGRWPWEPKGPTLPVVRGAACELQTVLACHPEDRPVVSADCVAATIFLCCCSVAQAGAMLARRVELDHQCAAIPAAPTATRCPTWSGLALLALSILAIAAAVHGRAVDPLTAMAAWVRYASTWGVCMILRATAAVAAAYVPQELVGGCVCQGGEKTPLGGEPFFFVSLLPVEPRVPCGSPAPFSGVAMNAVCLVAAVFCVSRLKGVAFALAAAGVAWLLLLEARSQCRLPSTPSAIAVVVSAQLAAVVCVVMPAHLPPWLTKLSAAAAAAAKERKGPRRTQPRQQRQVLGTSPLHSVTVAANVSLP